MTRTIYVTALLVAVCLLASTAARQVMGPTNVRIMSGLNNPRGLALGPNGAVYVAEAGAGGAGPCRVNAQNETRCLGLTGAISRFANGIQERVVTGLPSHALPSGDAATGPHDVSFQSTGDMFVIMGLGSDPSFGQLLQISPDGRIREAGDVSAYERDVNPAGGPLDSNPYGVLALPSARLVADAGANALVSVIPSGLVNTVAVFHSRPNRVTDSVPTAASMSSSTRQVRRSSPCQAISSESDPMERERYLLPT